MDIRRFINLNLNQRKEKVEQVAMKKVEHEK